MSCFGDLFALFRDKLMELCVDEAYQACRPYCGIDPTELPDINPCALCSAHCFDTGDQWGRVSETCGSKECRELWEWYWVPGKEGGGKRRYAFRQLHGRLIWAVPKELRREAILAAKLLYESKEKANAGKPRLRVAA